MCVRIWANGTSLTANSILISHMIFLHMILLHAFYYCYIFSRVTFNITTHI